MQSPGGHRRFLLVTGMPRSGTTGVGAALGLAPGSAYFYEPLNPLSGLPSVEDYFLFSATDAPDAELAEQLRRVFRIDLRLRAGIWPSDPRWRRAVKVFTGSRTRASALRCRLDPRVRTVIWKDPFASFLVPVLSTAYGLPTVVTIRSPEAAAASFKRLSWGFDLDRVHHHLERLVPGAPFLERGPHWERRRDSTINGALLWRFLYGYLDHTLPAPGEPSATPVLWANSRTLLTDPVTSYTTMYTALGLPFDEEIRAEIDRTYADEGSAEPTSQRAHERNRNVQQANSYWGKVLTEDDQRAVAEITADVRVSIERRTGPLG